jgi:MFS family permease
VADRTKLPRQVWLLGGVSFFADVSGEMIYPLLPLFIVAVLGATATDMGWIEGLAQAVVAFTAAWAGARSDRFRKRLPWVRVGYGLPVIGKLILVVANAWPLVLVGRTVDRLGKGFRGSPRDALIADATADHMRGRAFGLHRALDTAGALAGVVIATVLLWWLSGTPDGTGTPSSDPRPYRIIFTIAAVMGLAAVALTFLVKEVAEPSAPAKPAATKTRLALPASYWRVLAILLVFAVANSSDTFLLLRGANVGLSAWAVVAAYATYNVLYAAISYPAGVLSDKIGRWKLVGLGWAIYAIVYALFAIADTTTIWPAFAAYGLYMALTDGVGKALIADHAPKEHRGRAMGIFNLATGVTTIISSVVAGVLWDHVSPSAPFWLGSGSAVVAIVVLVIVRPRR